MVIKTKLPAIILRKMQRFVDMHRNRHVGLRDRKAMNVADILARHYDMSLFRRDVLTHAWMTIARELGADAERLRPTDRLTTELAHPPSPLFEGDDERAFLLTVLDFECRRAGIAFKAEHVDTIDHCVRTLYDCIVRGRSASASA